MSKSKTIIITDAGGRGAALVDKYGQSKHVGKILVVPGNDLMQINTKKEVKIFPDLKTTSVKEILQIVKKERADLVDVCQDNAVEVGLVDELNKLGIPAVGPTKAAGQIEWDKGWSRQFMDKYEIPHPRFTIFKSIDAGVNFVKGFPKRKWFIKASGLAGGYGVLPAISGEDAANKIRQLERFGKAAETYLVEEWLEGEEFSSYALSDGDHFVILGHAQDNKRLENFDQGPNTGGIGANSPPLVVDENIKKQVNKIFNKVIKWMKYEDRPYKGVLYLGGMVVKGKGLPAGPLRREASRQVYVIEFNARWGDPEVEVILPAIKNDLFELSMASINGTLDKTKIKFDEKSRVLVTACAKGYFDIENIKGKQIFGIEEVLKMKDITIYSSGIRRVGKKYVVNGSRIFHVVGVGENIIEAREKVYSAMKLLKIEGNNLHYRTDIGWRDLERIKNQESRIKGKL